MNYFIHFFEFFWAFYFLFSNYFTFIFGAKQDFNNIDNLISKLSISSLEDISVGIQLKAHEPCEDYFFLRNITLSNKTGVFLSVSDGHRNYEMSQYVNLLLLPYFLEAYNKETIEINDDKRIIYSFQKAYSRIEKELLFYSYHKYFNGNTLYALKGTCSLSALIINNKLFTANLGDSKARLFFLNKNGKYQSQKVSKVFNAKKKEELNKFVENWPNKNLVICKKHPKKCLIKRIYEQTRTIGDYALKYKIFDLPPDYIKNPEKKEYLSRKFEGPYIESDPDIHVYKLFNNDKYLILGSSGFWKNIKGKEIAEIIPSFIGKNFSNQKDINEVEKISYGLMDKVIEKLSINNKLSYQYVLDSSPSIELRRIRDDITILVCDLTKIK